MSGFTFESLEAAEWLEANGLGGWASGTFSGANSRRYHGVLVAALQPPADRRVLLSKLDESLAFGGKTFGLADNRFPDLRPSNAEAHVAAFARGLFPVVEFEAGGVRLRKTVAALHNENGTLIRYELLAAPPGPGAVFLGLSPFLAPRGVHELSRANTALRWDRRFSQGVLRLDPYEGGPTVFVSVPGSAFKPAPAWWRRFQYERERERGLDFEEDLFTYGGFEVPLSPGAPLDVLVSTQDPAGRDTDALWRGETARRESLRRPYDGRAPFLGRLALAADQFLVKRGADQKTVIAGYPWFEDWGRDTMISLRGLCLAQGRFEEAKAILQAFLAVLDQGMLPNRFTESGSAPEYNTVDATLWLFVAVHEYWLGTGDKDFALGVCLPALLDVLAWHERGTRYGIRVDGDGLLKAGADGVQLTWMDAKIGDRVVTPRRGKPVEINALWFNALKITEGLLRARGDGPAAERLGAKSETVRAAFGAAFWDDSAGRCHDVVTPEGPDPSPRPNQIFCLSLPFPLLEPERAGRLLGWVEANLLTPRGLRTLAPSDPRYVARYEGGVVQRDSAYHQGTVWAWLLGPYIDALIRFRGEAGKREARALWAAFEPHMDEACLGSVSEIFDAEAPHAPKGCFAQAWSVAELLRVASLLDGG